MNSLLGSGGFGTGGGTARGKAASGACSARAASGASQNGHQQTSARTGPGRLPLAEQQPRARAGTPTRAASNARAPVTPSAVNIKPPPTTVVPSIPTPSAPLLPSASVAKPSSCDAPSTPSATAGAALHSKVDVSPVVVDARNPSPDETDEIVSPYQSSDSDSDDDEPAHQREPTPAPVGIKSLGLGLGLDLSKLRTADADERYQDQQPTHGSPAQARHAVSCTPAAAAGVAALSTPSAARPASSGVAKPVVPP